MTNTGNESSDVVEPVSGLRANRRDILRTATGLAAAAVVGSALVERNQVVAAANSSISGKIGDLGPFDVQSFSWGASNAVSAGSGGGGAAGKVSFQDLVLTKNADISSPKLMVAVASGQHFPKATLTYADKKGSPILSFDLADVLLTNAALSASGDAGPTESISLIFDKVTMSYQGVSGSWDLKKNEGG